MLAGGVYTSNDPTKAFPRYGNILLEVFTLMGKTKRIKNKKDPMHKRWQKKGFDLAWVRPKTYSLNPSGKEENCIFNPDNIVILGIAKGHGDLPKEVQATVRNLETEKVRGTRTDRMCLEILERRIRDQIKIKPSPSQKKKQKIFIEAANSINKSASQLKNEIKSMKEDNLTESKKLRTQLNESEENLKKSEDQRKHVTEKL
jgi:hypothetical protein